MERGGGGRRTPLKKWTAEEDVDLLEAVRAVAPGAKGGSWSDVAKRMSRHKRSLKQCRERWSNQTNPCINKTPFTPDEDGMIVRMKRCDGSKWARIARSLPGWTERCFRTDNQVKNRWYSTLKRLVEEGAIDHSGVRKPGAGAGKPKVKRGTSSTAQSKARPRKKPRTGTSRSRGRGTPLLSTTIPTSSSLYFAAVPLDARTVENEMPALPASPAAAAAAAAAASSESAVDGSLAAAQRTFTAARMPNTPTGSSGASVLDSLYSSDTHDGQATEENVASFVGFNTPQDTPDLVRAFFGRSDGATYGANGSLGGVSPGMTLQFSPMRHLSPMRSAPACREDGGSECDGGGGGGSGGSGGDVKQNEKSPVLASPYRTLPALMPMRSTSRSALRPL